MSLAGTADRKNLALAGLCGAGCAVLVAALLFDQRMVAAGAKLLASSAFVLLALSAGALASRYGTLILAGLVLSWFGDAFLIGTSRHWFLLGLASFLLAHVAYVAAFVTMGIERRWVLAAAVPVVVIAAGVLSWLQPHLPAELVWPVRLYTAVISLMVITAVGTLGAGATPLIAVRRLPLLPVRPVRRGAAVHRPTVRDLRCRIAALLRGAGLPRVQQQSRSQYGTPAKYSARKSMNSRTR